MAENILIVDDDESLLGLCEVATRRAGYNVTTCTSGDQALKLLDSRAFDLVLTDLQMPGKTDGHGIVIAVKTRHPTSEVILMTGAPTLQSAIEILKSGAYDYILKPFDVEHLTFVIRRCLDHRKLVHDLSAERTLRRELESAYQELQKLEQLKESFLARVSHELKTPLSELLIAIELMDESAAQAVPESAKSDIAKRLAILKNGARRMEETITELLAFVDIQKRPNLSSTVPVPLEDLCRKAAERFKPLWEPRRLSLTIRFDPGVSPAIGDPALLTTAFEHLIHNAIVFNRDGGMVTVTARMNQGRVVVSVTDTGEGIPESEFNNIFDSFYQIANFLTRKVGGMGLGLAITRRIVEAHRGDITIDSRVGVGTTFTVTLPAATKEPAGVATA